MMAPPAWRFTQRNGRCITPSLHCCWCVAAGALLLVLAGDYANVGEEVQIDWYRLDRPQEQQKQEQQ